MAKQVITVCDLSDTPGSTCIGQVRTFKLWIESERTARSVDLCEEHARPLTALMTAGSEVELPTKPRMTMQVTRLKPTDATRHLKRKD